jgi:hypothetical protein
MNRACVCSAFAVLALCSACGGPSALTNNEWQKTCEAIPTVQSAPSIEGVEGYAIDRIFREVGIASGKVFVDSKNDPYYYPLVLESFVEAGMKKRDGYRFMEYEFIRDWGHPYEFEFPYSRKKGVYRAERANWDSAECDDYRKWSTSKGHKPSSYCVIVREAPEQHAKYLVQIANTKFHDFDAHDSFSCTDISITERIERRLLFSARSCSIGWTVTYYPFMTDWKGKGCGAGWNLERILVPPKED